MVLQQSFSKFKKQRAFWDALATVIVSVFIVGSIVVEIKEKPKTFLDFAGSEPMLTAFLTALFFAGIYTVIYLVYLRKEYVHVYNSQARQIENFFPDTLNIKIFDSRLNRYPDENGNIVPNVFIQVHNNNQKKKIIELEGQIVTLAHISLNPKTKKVEALPFSLNTCGLWDNKDARISLMPEKDAFLCVSTLELEKLVFGEMKFSIPMAFEKESVYGLSLSFVGKFEGETDYRKSIYDTVIYASPKERRLLSGGDALFYCENMSNTLRKVIEMSKNYFKAEN